jgi:hypothetical protein
LAALTSVVGESDGFEATPNLGSESLEVIWPAAATRSGQNAGTKANTSRERIPFA